MGRVQYTELEFSAAERWLHWWGDDETNITELYGGAPEIAKLVYKFNYGLWLLLNYVA